MNRRFKIFVVSTSSCLVALLLLGAVHGRSAAPEDTYRHLAVYTEVLSRIKSDYVEEPDMKSVTLGAVNGLLESIDPYASYPEFGPVQAIPEEQRVRPKPASAWSCLRSSATSESWMPSGPPAGQSGLDDDRRDRDHQRRGNPRHAPGLCGNLLSRRSGHLRWKLAFCGSASRSPRS